MNWPQWASELCWLIYKDTSEKNRQSAHSPCFVKIIFSCNYHNWYVFKQTTVEILLVVKPFFGFLNYAGKWIKKNLLSNFL